MSCFSRASQAVLPNRDRNEQVNRVVNRTYVNKVCIFYFFYYFIFKRTIYGKIHGALYPMFSRCGEYNVKSKLFIVKHYYSKTFIFFIISF
jgi:hypothetical protein